LVRFVLVAAFPRRCVRAPWQLRGGVMMTVRLERWGAAAALVCWAAVGLPALAGDLVVAPSAWWWAAYLTYGLLLGVAVLPLRVRLASPNPVLLAAQLLAGAAAFVLDRGYGFSSAFLIINVATAALLLPLWMTGTLVAAQTVLIVAARLWWNHGPTDFLPIVEAAVFAALQLFVAAMVEVAQRERRARAEAAALTVELTAAQSRLAEASRTTERLRIARDMHDTIGHQLTALAVNLEVATHLADGAAAEYVERSRRLAKDMLSDVRELVSRTREPELDLQSALHSLFSGVPGLAVHLSVDSDLRVTDTAQVEAVLRCAQEVLTNTLRHADASNLWVSLTRTSDRIEVCARDDGRGDSRVNAGHGLTGMRERFEELGGTVDFHTKAGRGSRSTPVCRLLKVPDDHRGTGGGPDPGPGGHPQPAGTCRRHRSGG
jgi:signal transduction histidine kinase